MRGITKNGTPMVPGKSYDSNDVIVFYDDLEFDIFVHNLKIKTKKSITPDYG